MELRDYKQCPAQCKVQSDKQRFVQNGVQSDRQNIVESDLQSDVRSDVQSEVENDVLSDKEDNVLSDSQSDEQCNSQSDLLSDAKSDEQGATQNDNQNDKQGDDQKSDHKQKKKRSLRLKSKILENSDFDEFEKKTDSSINKIIIATSDLHDASLKNKKKEKRSLSVMQQEDVPSNNEHSDIDKSGEEQIDEQIEQEVENQNFRLQAKNLFLTYPQCTLQPEEALAILETKLQINEYLIAVENHIQKGRHLHCYINCKKKVDIRSAHRLDLDGFHGNYQGCRSLTAVKKYCTKEKNYITNIYNFAITAPAVAAVKLAIEGDVNSAINIIINDANLARDYIRDSLRIEQSIKRLAKSNDEIIKNYKFKNVNNVLNWNRSKHVLWLHGKTNTGKTQFALSLFKNPLLVRHIDQLKKLDNSYDGIVFDDMNFSYWKREEQIHIVDVEETTAVNVKHGHVEIKKGLPRVFTSNNRIFTNDPSIKRRIRYIKIDDDIRDISENEPEKSNSCEIPDSVFESED
ncbi:rep [Reticulomyxa filosa]|uniref:Rep n=1 Tax=Reticulomyxa filosa TaxID=46433 RepID=X6MQ48_RETFI|nr:rep [Reticulomyxa filosa]|eukprot:ETO15557.1 rep [Reticulomyxa filosa]